MATSKQQMQSLIIDLSSQISIPFAYDLENDIINFIGSKSYDLLHISSKEMMEESFSFQDILADKASFFAHINDLDSDNSKSIFFSINKEKHIPLIFHGCRNHTPNGYFLEGTLMKDSQENEMPYFSESFTILFENIYLAMQIFGMDGYLLQTNSAWRKMWKIIDDSKFINSYNILTDPQSVELGIADGVKMVLQGKKFSGYYTYAPEKSNIEAPTRSLQTHIFPIFDLRGKQYIAFTSIDLTEIHKTKTLLHRRSLRLSSILKAIPDLMFVLDRGGTYVDYYAQNENSLAFPASEIIGKNVEDLHKNSILAAKILSLIQQTLDDDEIHFFEYQLNVPKGKRNFEARLVPCGPNEVLAIVRDTTENKIQEKKTIESQKMDIISKLASGIAHDFNNMLGGISGFTSILKTKEQDIQKKSFLRQIELAVEKATDLTDQLMTLSKYSITDIETVDPVKVIDETVDILRRTTSKMIEFVADYQTNHYLIDADKEQLKQVLMNILINAIEAMNFQGVINITIQNICLDDSNENNYELPKGNYLEITIQDTGCGISEANKKRIFEPFFTTKNIDDSRNSGLGLTAAFAIIHNLQGAIRIHSEEGIGTTVDIFLPKSQHNTQQQILDVNMLDENVEEKKILIADDEEIILLMLAQMVHILGYKTILAQDGLDAWEKFQANKDQIACILLDLQMPKMNGSQVFDKILETKTDVPVYFTTGLGANDATRKLLAKGVKGILVKPFQIEDLADLLKHEIK